ncbi:E3 SUMO-protein ligase nse2 [Seiridium cupressi]
MSSRRGLLSNAPASAQRQRNSARPGSSTQHTTASSRSAHDKIQLPPYEPLLCSLDLTARRALTELSNNATEARKYTAELANSTKLLGESVAEINDRYTEQKAKLRNRLEKQGADGGNPDEETQALQDAVEKLGQEVPELTRQCDEGVREVIDWGVELEDSRDALGTAVKEVEDESREAEQREQAAKDRRERIREARERRLDNPHPEDEDDEEPEDEDEDEEAAEIRGPLKRLKANRTQLRADYEEKSLHQRYGLNNDYIQFKKLWHSAKHGDNKPVPDPSRWFTNNYDDDGDEGDQEDEDEDLIVAGEKKDLRCPLSMVMMREPYTSAKCNHTFEKTAIIEFLGSKPGHRAMCPQTGCSQEVSITDFSLDQFMIRQIKRSQRQNDDDDDEDEDMAEEDPDESSSKKQRLTPDVVVRFMSQRNIKKERRGDVIEDDEDEEMEED